MRLTSLNTHIRKPKKKIPLYIGLIRMATSAIQYRSTHYSTVYTEKKQNVTPQQHTSRRLLDPDWEK